MARAAAAAAAATRRPMARAAAAAAAIRGDQRYEVVAKAEPLQIARLNALMAEKYGLGDSVVAALAGSPENGVAVRLVPAATED